MIELCYGNIFKSNADVFVNPVNCVGVMGKGLALQFKNKFPFMYEKYQLLCANKELFIGKPYLIYNKPKEHPVLLFPTKKHWKENSKIEYIEEGLNFIIERMNDNWSLIISSIAFPLLGCGNGGLNKEEVLDIMINKLNQLNDIKVEIYE